MVQEDILALEEERTLTIKKPKFPQKNIDLLKRAAVMTVVGKWVEQLRLRHGTLRLLRH